MTKEMWQLARMHELKDFGERLSHYENDEMLIDEVDEGFCNMMGYTQSELMIRSCGKVGDLIYPPDCEEIRYQIRKNLKQSGSYTCRYRTRSFTSTGMAPTACTASVCIHTPCLWAMAAISLMG